MLTIRGLGAGYGAREVLHDVDVDVAPGEIVAVLGRNGSGRSTLAKAIASEYAGAGVTSNALAPALIDTEMIASMPDMRGAVPVGRLGTPDDVAAVVAFLCSAHAGYITGEVVDVNGGFLID